MFLKNLPARAAAAMIASTLAFPVMAFEGPTDDTELGPTFLLSLGGKLYDDPWTVLAQSPPSGRNPALTGVPNVSSHDSWRCVTCHGWDYGGAVVSILRFPDLRGLRGTDPTLIADRLRDRHHPFPTDQLPDLAIEILSFFISEGQYDPADYMDEGGQAAGNPEFGREIFEGACINCHGLDGRDFLMRERRDPSSLGWVARNRPEQALHRILNGVPAREMLSLRFMSDEQIADLFAYVQALDPGR